MSYRKDILIREISRNSTNYTNTHYANLDLITRSLSPKDGNITRRVKIKPPPMNRGILTMKDKVNATAHFTVILGYFGGFLYGIINR